ncbi:ABC transporter ATP-binding protein [Desulfovibrio gilichinskyi]|uniref:Nickel import system ATP-binding protein NikD n=1 Tax=Desulfovibrio gilichinskyi TaxID=1519643 RepID=A0A1X7F051_9BACT|nr:ABC transporter ATP-binding protein [Desulfovibrio gilichinskyi]SMF43185.1 peptide/nickel transport system ATP-binding protein [Desulfovibrio gilichinskyi]
MLDVKQLSICFSNYSFGLKKQEVCAIRSLDLSVKAGEVVAVVGQSGAGKSLLAHALLGILPRNAQVTGSLSFKGMELTPKEMVRLRGREIALVPQSVAYLNPLLHVGVQISRAAELSGIAAKSSWSSTIKALKRYKLDEEVAKHFPFQLSGGMARRILTATATIGGASLILADEPTNGLDEDTAKETLEHLRQLADCGKAVLLITHDIEAALQVADKVTVFCGGVTVEEAFASDFYGENKLRHPYSQALWAALPTNNFVNDLPEKIHAANNGGCPFSATCCERGDLCGEVLPELREFNGGRVRCQNA